VGDGWLRLVRASKLDEARGRRPKLALHPTSGPSVRTAFSRAIGGLETAESRAASWVASSSPTILKPLLAGLVPKLCDSGIKDALLSSEVLTTSALARRAP
jgi:hypothetical protein